ncbi:unnamed protein product [Lactuca virosa]|uniref:Uncharacterized protein n=1 Tax=Lactuca virosa TaxID=75947 RepID=A0AAU9PWI7_9ASTR|nr:unnamed protein product [Lactuca virosa]
MGSIFQIIIVVLFTLSFKGYGQCEIKDITVGTERTSEQIQGKQEWKVSFINTCKCSQQALIVSCNGYQTVEKVDPSIFAPVGNNNCIVNGDFQRICDGLPTEFYFQNIPTDWRRNLLRPG